VDEIAVTFEHSTLKCLTSYTRDRSLKILSETIMTTTQQTMQPCGAINEGNLSQFPTCCTKFLIYLYIIHLLKSSTCFKQYAAHLQEV
jgi:hypothetical protein